MKRLYRCTSDEKIAGVCSGIAKYFGLDPTLIRVLWAILVLCYGTGILAYIVCVFIIPEENEIIDI